MRIWLALALITACSDSDERADPIIKREIVLEIPRAAAKADEPPSDCPDLVIRVTRSQVMMIRGLHPTVLPSVRDTVDRAEVLAAFQRYRYECIGPVEIQASSDVPYSMFVDVMGYAKDQGFQNIRLAVAP